MEQNTPDAQPAINARALRRWINENYDGAASCANWSLKECIDFAEEYHVEGVAAFTRTVIRTNLNANLRTSRQVEDAVRHLNRKLTRFTSKRGVSITLYAMTATMEDGAIAVRMTEPDRTFQDLPDKVWAEVFLDVNMSAVAMYRLAGAVHSSGLHNMIQDHLKANPIK